MVDVKHACLIKFCLPWASSPWLYFLFIIACIKLLETHVWWSVIWKYIYAIPTINHMPLVSCTARAPAERWSLWFSSVHPLGVCGGLSDGRQGFRVRDLFCVRSKLWYFQSESQFHGKTAVWTPESPITSTHTHRHTHWHRDSHRHVHKQKLSHNRRGWCSGPFLWTRWELNSNMLCIPHYYW